MASSGSLRVVEATALPPSRIVRLVDEVSYAPGEIVTRPLLRAKGASVTLLAFDAGQELAEHTSSGDALVQVLEGSLLVTVAGERRVAAAGEALVMPAGIPHAVAAPGRAKMLLTLVRTQP